MAGRIPIYRRVGNVLPMRPGKADRGICASCHGMPSRAFAPATAQLDDLCAHPPRLPQLHHARVIGARARFPGDLLQSRLLQLRVRQQPFQGGVLAFEVFEPSGVIGLQPAELVPPPVIRLLGDLQLPACRRDVRTLAEVAMRSSLPARKTGRRTLTQHGSATGGHARCGAPDPASLGCSALPNRNRPGGWPEPRQHARPPGQVTER